MKMMDETVEDLREQLAVKKARVAELEDRHGV